MVADTASFSTIVADEVRIMLVVPKWPRAPWFKLFRRLVERQFRVDGPLYLTDDGKLRPAPRWATVIAVVDGARYLQSCPMYRHVSASCVLSLHLSLCFSLYTLYAFRVLSIMAHASDAQEPWFFP